MTSYRIEKAIDQNDLARKASQLIASLIDLALEERERAQIALSGGSSPQATYRLLGKEHLPWNRVDVCLGDERWVDQSDKASNSGMLNRTLLASRPGSSCRFHATPTIECSNPKESAIAFSNTLNQICSGKPPVFDLILLGLGDDGHTASLFPYSEALNIKDLWVTCCQANGHDRITLTSPVLSAARKVIFLVSGSSKQVALKRLINPNESIIRTPAKLVQPESEILILADADAASFS